MRDCAILHRPARAQTLPAIVRPSFATRRVVSYLALMKCPTLGQRLSLRLSRDRSRSSSGRWIFVRQLSPGCNFRHDTAIEESLGGSVVPSLGRE